MKQKFFLGFEGNGMDVKNWVWVQGILRFSIFLNDFRKKMKRKIKSKYTGVNRKVKRR